MSLQTDIATLSNTPFFMDCHEEALRLLAFSGDRHQLSENMTLYHQGETADCAYVLMSGQLDLFTRSKDGTDKHIKVAHSGTLLTELALVLETTRQFTAKAATNCELLSIDNKLFLRLVEEYPDIAAKLQTRIQDNLKNLTQDLYKVAQTLEKI